MFAFHLKIIDAESLIKTQTGCKQDGVLHLERKNLLENCVDDSQPTVLVITVKIWSGISNSCLVDLRMKV